MSNFYTIRREKDFALGPTGSFGKVDANLR